MRYAHRMQRWVLLAVLALAACGNRYSPDEYNTRAVQQANRASQGVVLGFRAVRVASDGNTGTAAGAAAGGAVGGAIGAPDRVASALGAVGGALVGGLLGTAAERMAASADAFEYIVRKSSGDLVSVTQRDLVPLPVGARVLVIEGAQARIVADYTLPVQVPVPAVPDQAAAQAVRSPAPPPEPDHGDDVGMAPATALDRLPEWVMGGAVPAR